MPIFVQSSLMISVKQNEQKRLAKYRYGYLYDWNLELSQIGAPAVTGRIVNRRCEGCGY